MFFVVVVFIVRLGGGGGGNFICFLGVGGEVLLFYSFIFLFQCLKNLGVTGFCVFVCVFVKLSTCAFVSQNSHCCCHNFKNTFIHSEL